MTYRFLAATSNTHKLQEIRKILSDSFKIESLNDFGFTGEIPETASTFEGNALQKAHYIHQIYKVDCLADDSGLEVKALDGRPGIYSARYAGPRAGQTENNEKLLSELGKQTDRSARFVCCIALIMNGQEYTFEGELSGNIALSPTGVGGFGYDPLFIPLGSSRSLAEFSAEEKNMISHRGKALRLLNDFLVSQQGLLA